MKVLAARESLRDIGGLQLRALRGRMRSQPARHGDEDPPAFASVAPFAPLAHRGLEDLQRMEIGVFPQYGAAERRDERLARMPERKRPRDQPRRLAHRALPIEGLKKRFAD